FFFQAEDGIRDLYVTGVQTCALPICHAEWERLHLELALTALEREPAERVDLLDVIVGHRIATARRARAVHHQLGAGTPQRTVVRSEERRVGKECRSRWCSDH